MEPFLILLVLAFIALPIVAIVRTARLSRRITELDWNGRTQEQLDSRLASLTNRVFELERLLRPNAASTPTRPADVAPAQVPSSPEPETAVTPAAIPGSSEPPAILPPAVGPISAPAETAPAPFFFAGYAEPSPEAPFELAAHAEAPKEFETNIGLTWINRIAAVTLILAAAFFFRYAVDNQWIGETGRIVLGIAAGFAALGVGEWAWRRGHSIYAQGVTALGIAVLYLSFYAAFAFYHLPAVPQAAAFFLMALTTALGGVLAMRYDTAVISILAMLGGYATPVLLSTGQDRPWILFGYILLLDVGALAVGRVKRWPYLAAVALGGTTLLYSLWFGAHFNADRQLVALAAPLAYFALFALLDSELVVTLAQLLLIAAVASVVAWVGADKDRPWLLFGSVLLLDLGALVLARIRAWLQLAPIALAGTTLAFLVWFTMYFRPDRQAVATICAFGFYAMFVLLESEALACAAQVLASVALLAIASSVGAGESWLFHFGWLFLALAAAGVTISEWRGWLILSRAGLLSFWICFGLWQGTRIWAHPGMAVPVAVAGFALFVGQQAWRIGVRRQTTDEVSLALVVLNAASAFGIVYFQLEPAYHAWLGLTAVAFAGVHLWVAKRIWNGDNDARERIVTPAMLLVGVALAFLTLAVPIQFSAYRITMAWALEGAALAWIGARTGAQRVRQAALIVFALTLFRLLAIDAWIYTSGTKYDLLANSRFLAFAVAAAGLWLGVHSFEDRRQRLVVYVAGHVVLLWALVMEVVGQAERSAPADRVFSVGSVSVSVLIAAYGVMLIGAFVLGRFAVNRLLGLLLLGGVVLKLYLNDVWVLDRIYRVIAFGFLGILLLLTSFLFSRFKTRIGHWWKDEANPS